MEKEYSQTFFLSAGETNAEHEMSLPLLTSKIIDISTAHANSLGIGNPAMESLHCGWVLSRIAIEMTRYPEVNETYRLTTWVTDWNKHYSERCYMISDAEGNPIGYARSIWMVLHTDTHESVGLGHLTPPEGMLSEKECPIARAGRHAAILPEDFEGDLPRNSVRATESDRKYTFRYCDLDFYRHVNTVRYVALLLNSYTLQEMDTRRVGRMEISFMHEGRYGMTVAVRRAAESESESESDSFTLIDIAGDRPILSARISMHPRR